ncbi:hypothetical protein TWF730_008437 [Orbilia blumenaviensis]|uniref:F-box domain-containing protein n=1 Tax=Orbilia blumenaviensis TaxID=1796055 RepID=A0AAV9V507_9PEZI
MMSTKSALDVKTGTNGAVGLMHLPPEILWDISSYVKPCDLPKLVRVCKRVNEICIPRIYNTIILHPLDLKSPKSLVRGGNANFRHIRSLQIASNVENAGYWLEDLPGDAIDWISNVMRGQLDKFLSYLPDGVLREFAWRTDMLLGESTVDYLLQHQQNIDSLELLRLGTRRGFPAHPPERAEFSEKLLQQNKLVRLEVGDIPGCDGFELLQTFIRTIIKHQKTLKHIRFRCTSYETDQISQPVYPVHITDPIVWVYGTGGWSRRPIKDTISSCGIKLDPPSELIFPALESLDISDFELPADVTREAASLLDGVLQIRQLRSLKFRNCGYLDSMLWPVLSKYLSHISVLHLTIHLDYQPVYSFLEDQNVSTTLKELRLVMRVGREVRFPDLRRHSKTLRVLYLAMIDIYDQGPAASNAPRAAYICPTPREAVYQLMSLPQLEELAIAFPNPKISPIKINRNSFPSLRVLWVLSIAGILEARGPISENFFDSIFVEMSEPGPAVKSMQQKDYFDNIFTNPKAYPNNLQVVGVGLRENSEHPTDISVIAEILFDSADGLELTAELQDFNNVRKSFTILEGFFNKEEYSWVKVFGMGRGVWNIKRWA